MKFKTQLTAHNSSFLTAASTLNVKGLTSPSLLVAARITLIAANASCLKQPNTYSRVGITIYHPYLHVAVSDHSLQNNSIIN